MAVLELSQLRGGPWDTSDPFLFAVYHDDLFPSGTTTLGPAPSELRGRRIGSDFGNPRWNMYHGETVPGFPKHPHRGFETVTLVRHGRVDHSDSLGACGRFGGGDVQWMTAGAGISHCEMFPLLETDKDNRLELFQIWVNLPRRSKMDPPFFKMLWAEDIPRAQFVDDQGRETDVTIIAGALGDTQPLAPPPGSYASDSESAFAIWTIRMAPGARWELPASPAGARCCLYCFQGGDQGASVGGRSFQGLSMASLRLDAVVELRAGRSEAEFLLLQGRPIGEPVVQHGPFVMTSQAEIRQAFSDYQRTGFGDWPWPNDAPVHPRQQPRFARYPDGRTETPGSTTASI